MSHTVTLKPSGRRFAVAADESILDAALRAGVALPYGCRNGACRSCRGRVLEGEVTYRDPAPRGVAPGDAERGFTLICSSRPTTDAVIEIDELDPSLGIEVRTVPCRVRARTLLAHDVMRLDLDLRAGDALTHLAGQYVDVVLRDGRRRAYSLATPPGSAGLELHIRRVPGGSFSEYVFEHLKARAILRLHGPLGSFYLRRDTAGPVVLIAGGTGLAPVKSIVEEALGTGFTDPMHLYWGVRARRDLYLDEVVREWTRRWPNLSYTPVLSEPAPDDDWSGRTGLVHAAVLEDIPDFSGHSVYMSGPPPMVEAGRAGFSAAGLDPSRLHSDAFEHAYQTGHE